MNAVITPSRMSFTMEKSITDWNFKRMAYYLEFVHVWQETWNGRATRIHGCCGASLHHGPDHDYRFRLDVPAVLLYRQIST